MDLNVIKGFNYDTFNFSSCTILSCLGRLTKYAKDLFNVGTPYNGDHLTGIVNHPEEKQGPNKSKKYVGQLEYTGHQICTTGIFYLDSMNLM